MDEVVAGTTVPLEVSVSLDTGVAFNLAGPVTFGLARARGEDVLVTKRSPSAGGDATQINVTDAASGELVVWLRPADTRGLRGPYVWEIVAQDGNGDRYPAATGELNFVPGIAP